MDTRFWGPSGWRLLHLITFGYTPQNTKQKHAVQEVFETLPYVLPCKFCRYSLSEYMEKESLADGLKSRQALTQWLYRIHNRVNDKLRGQGIPTEPDPPFAAVQKVYEERLAAGCSHVEFDGWDFLFSIAENHPYAVHGSTPMPDAPPENTIQSDADKNRWNTMSSKERMPYYTRFWSSLGEALPFDTWRESWAGCHPRIRRIAYNAKAAKRELWRIRRCLESKLDLINKDTFAHVCKRLMEHKSGCHKTRRARTCRRIRKKTKKFYRRRKTQ